MSSSAENETPPLGQYTPKEPSSLVSASYPSALIEQLPVATTPDTDIVHPFRPQTGEKGEEGREKTERLFQELLQRVLEATQMDVTHYKEGTLRRQIERRITALRLPSLEDYLGFVRANSDEIKLLQQSFMISVTEFFRDPAVFTVLRRVIAGLISTKQPGDAIRAWVPGSATGEEAYSIAIILADVLGERLAQFDVRVFATDLDPNAIQTARLGVYPRSALENLDIDLRERYLVPQGRALRVGRTIRERCVFANHDLVRQPPFMGMDLISCRNVLIYFQPSLQDEVLVKFHYALNRNGYLLLGQSETAGATSKLFEPADGQYRLYRRCNVPTPRPLLISQSALSNRPQQPSPLPGCAGRTLSAESAMQERLLQEYAPASVLVNRDWLPLHFFGKVERYLNLPKGAADFSLLALCRPELHGEIRTLLHLMSQEGKTSTVGRSQPLALEDGAVLVRMVARRVDLDLVGNDGAILISFEEQPVFPETLAADQEQPPREIAPDEVDELRLELAATREHLRAVIEETETSNEELQSLNEELQASSEELQASNEELQSTNEELITLNDELGSKSTELADTNDTLSNILDSIQVGLVVVDERGKVRCFNPLAVRVFGLMPEDVGQRLCGVPCTLDLPELHEQIAGVVGSGVPVIQRASQESRHYLMQISPYLDQSGQRTGAVLIFADVSELRRAEVEREQAEITYRSLFENMLNGLAYCRMLYDHGQPQDFIYLRVNAAFETLTGLKDVVGKKVTEVIPGIRESDTELFEIYGRVALSGQPERFELYLKSLGQWFLVSVYSPCKEHFVAVFDVITERKRTEEALRESERCYRELVQNANSAIIRWFHDGTITFFNEYAQTFFGWRADEVIGQHVGILVPDRESTGADLTALVQEVVNHPDRYLNNVNENICRDGRRVWMTWTNRAIFDEYGQVREILAIGNDITERKRAEETFRHQEILLREAGELAHIGAWEFDPATLQGSWTEETARIHEVDPTAPTGTTLGLSFYSGESRARIEAAVKAAIEHGAPYDLELEFVSAKGTPKWVRTICHPVLENGKVVRVRGSFQDITGSKRMEQNLRASEEKLRLFIEHAPAAIAMLDRNMCYLFASRRWITDYRLEDREIIGHSHYEIFPEIPERWKAIHHRCLAGATERCEEDPFPRLDGIIDWVRWEIRPWYESGETVGGIVIMSEDITQQIQARDAVRESEQNYRTLADSGRALIWRAGTDKLCNYFNRVWLEFTGRSLEQESGNGWVEGVHPDDLEHCLAAYVDSFDRHERFSIDYRLRRYDGEYRWIQDDGCPCYDSTGKFTGYIGYCLDITDRKRVEEEIHRFNADLEHRVAERTTELQDVNRALAERAAEIADLYNNAPCGYHSLNSEGTFAAINDTELSMLGYAREEVVGRLNFRQLISPDQISLFEQRFQEYAKTGYIHNLDYEITCKDGSLLPVMINAVVVRDAEGNFLYTRATMFDNRELKERERQIAALNMELERRAVEAEAANRAKTTFLANMSHEIRTPMNAIVGLTYLLRRSVRDPEQEDRLGKIAAAAHHLLAILNDILDLSKIEAGKLTLEQTDFNLDSVLNHVCTLVADKAQAKEIELVMEIDPALAGDCILRGDPTRLTQLLLNYLGNAVKFTEHGSITLRGWVLEESTDQLLLRFEVQDTGLGIAPGVLPRLFAAFEQANGSTSRRHGGTGLGLAINQRLASLMGGKVGVESVPGIGSTFWCTVRLGKGSKVSARHLDGALRGKRVLLADDLPEARLALSGMLRALGLQVEAVGSGMVALVAAAAADARDEPFDLVILDWRMPEMDGLETARRLRALSLDWPPVGLLVATYDEPKLQDAARQAGLHAVLIKPITPSALHDALLDALNTPVEPVEPSELPSISITTALERTLAQRHQGSRLLLAEDNLISQEVALDLLRETGLVVELATNGQEAVELAGRTDYDLILMDVQMPNLDGLAATRAIRRLAGRERTPIIAMTANAFGEDRIQCLEAGMDDHIGKPVDPEILFATLLKWLPERSDRIPPPPGDALPSFGSTSAGEDLAWLVDVPGLDSRTGLKLAHNRPDTYIRLLRQFVVGHDNDLADLHRGLAVANQDQIRRLAHSLRGVAGILGATRLQTLATELETAVKTGQSMAELERLGMAVEAELAGLVVALRHALPPAEMKTATTADQEQADVVLGELDTLLAEDNIRTNAVFQEAAPLLRAVLGDAANELERQIGRFAYEQALQSLRKIMAERRKSPDD
ncbi:MAG: PAS domain S-box protein [Candidatus Competibacter sp.]